MTVKKKPTKPKRKKKGVASRWTSTNGVNPDGSYCREVPECDCGWCR
jgi:hypothetical protein